MDYREVLTELAATYCAAVGRSEARVANLAGCGGGFFASIRNGKTCSVDTLNRITRWFATNWPADLAWPAGIERPAADESLRIPVRRGAPSSTAGGSAVQPDASAEAA